MSGSNDSRKVVPVADRKDAFMTPTTLPRFDPSWLGTFAPFAEAVADSFQVSPDLPGALILGAVSVATLGKHVVKVNNDWIEPTQLYICAVAGSSERKSPTLDRIFRPIKEYETACNLAQKSKRDVARMKLAALNTRERKAVKNGDVAEMERIVKDREALESLSHEMTLFVADATSEAMPPTMVDNGGCLAVVSAEGGIFANMAGRYTKGIPNLDVFLQGYSSEAVKINRIRLEKPIHIPRASLSMVLCVQPDVVRKVLDDSAMATRGLTARFIWCFPEELAGRRRIHAPEIPESVESVYTDRVHALLVQPRPETPNVIRLSESASRLFDDIREKNEARILGDLSGALKDSGWTGKHDGRLLRIAATLALIDGDSEIEKEHLWRAQKIGEWAIEHARSMMERTGDAPRAKAHIVWETICRLGELHFTMRELQRKLGDREGLKRKDDILDVLDMLEEEDYVVPVEVEPEEMKLGVMRWNVSYTHSDEVLQKSE